jgi:hypothetical protein
METMGDIRAQFIALNKKQSNADRIRAMTDEELADELLELFACFYAVEWSREQVLNLLKQEATNDPRNMDARSAHG